MRFSVSQLIETWNVIFDIDNKINRECLKPQVIMYIKLSFQITIFPQKALILLALNLINKVFFRHILVEAKIKFLLLLTTFLSYWGFSSLFIARWAWEKQQAVPLSRAIKLQELSPQQKRRKIYDCLWFTGKLSKIFTETFSSFTLSFCFWITNCVHNQETFFVIRMPSNYKGVSV